MLKKQGIICQTEPNEWILTYNLGNLTILTRTSRNLIFFLNIIIDIVLTFVWRKFQMLM